MDSANLETGQACSRASFSGHPRALADVLSYQAVCWPTADTSEQLSISRPACSMSEAASHLHHTFVDCVDRDVWVNAGLLLKVCNNVLSKSH